MSKSLLPTLLWNGILDPSLIQNQSQQFNEEQEQQQHQKTNNKKNPQKPNTKKSPNTKKTNPLIQTIQSTYKNQTIMEITKIINSLTFTFSVARLFLQSFLTVYMKTTVEAGYL